MEKQAQVFNMAKYFSMAEDHQRSASRPVSYWLTFLDVILLATPN